MCGIAGTFQFDGLPDLEKVKKAVASLQHRGPDHQGIHTEDNVALGHARLSIIDLESGHQPLHLSKRNLHLVANGEIYNYVELRKQFIAEPYQTNSDCEPILHLYAEQGVESFGHLNGMFAVALYDGAKKQLILVRDRLGIKPLFYARVGNKFVFGSEIKSVLAQLDSIPAIRPQALLEFMQNQFYCGEETIFEGIKQLLPGHYLLVDSNGNTDSKAYWSLDTIKTKDIDLAGAQEEFQSIFNQVMLEHMRSDVPLGLFLSGGIDSSLLLAELTARMEYKLLTFSVGYEGVKMEDELSQAEALAKQFDTEHYSLKVSREQLFNRIPLSIWAADDLMRDYACLPLLMLSEQAAKSVKVVFSGEGGDEAFAGYRRYRSNLEQTLKSLLLGGGGLRSSGQLSSQVMSKLLPNTFRQLDFRSSVKQAWQNSPKQLSMMQRRQHVDINTALESNLLVKADRMLMAFGIEGRVPFCDHRIIEFGLSLPDKIKYPEKQGKWLLRQWAKSVLPADHLARPKRGFYVPVKEWFSGDFLKNLGDKLVSNRAIKEYFNAPVVADIVAAQQAGKNFSRELYTLMQFAIWHKITHENLISAPSSAEDPLDWL